MGSMRKKKRMDNGPPRAANLANPFLDTRVAVAGSLFSWVAEGGMEDSSMEAVGEALVDPIMYVGAC